MATLKTNHQENRTAANLL